MALAAMLLALVSACSPLGDDDDEDPTEPVAAPAGEAPTVPVGSSTPVATPIATPRAQSGSSGTPRAGVASPRTSEPDDEELDANAGTPVGNEETGGEAQGVDSTEETAPEPTTVVVSDCEEPGVLPERTGRQNRVVAEDALRFRAGPGTSCDEITSLAVDTPVRVLSGVVESEDDDIEWVKVDVDGTEGWVAVEFLENPPDN